MLSATSYFDKEMPASRSSCSLVGELTREMSRYCRFDLNVVLPEQLYSHVLEVGGRYDAQGTELEPLELEAAVTGLRAAYTEGFRACAIVFMHGYRFTAHEAAVAQAAREMGFTQVSVSHEVSPLMK